jgi:hypothetical protein
LNPFSSRPPAAEKPPPRAGQPAKDQARRARAKEAERKLQEEWQAKVVAVGEKWKKLADEYAELHLKPRKADIRVTHFGLAWAPFWQTGGGAGVAAYPSEARG